MEVVVRPATSNDLGEIERLWRELTERHWALQPHRPFRPDAWNFRRRDFERALNTPGTNRVLLAEGDTRAVGVLWCEIRDAEPGPRLQPARYAEIEVLVVADAARGQGIGAELMQACHQWLERNGVTRTVLKVVEENEGARRFYERLGFRAVNVIMERDG